MLQMCIHGNLLRPQSIHVVKDACDFVLVRYPQQSLHAGLCPFPWLVELNQRALPLMRNFHSSLQHQLDMLRRFLYCNC